MLLQRVDSLSAAQYNNITIQQTEGCAMTIRRYRSEDCRRLTELFYDTVHSVNARDYAPEQLDAWATGQPDLEAWDRSLHAHESFVAEENGVIIGFGDIDQSGYLDRLFVDKDHQGRGVATALCDALEAAVRPEHYTTHASITARPFFEKRGYHVVRQQRVERQGVSLTNFVMEK